MNRLYPKVLQSQQDIQDLRQKVKNAEVDRQSKDGRIANADQQIAELTDQLGSAEQEQQNLFKELGGVERSGAEMREALDEARQESLELRGKLGHSERDASERARQLRKAEEQIEQQNKQLLQAEREARERLAQLAHAERRRLEIHATLEISYSDVHNSKTEEQEAREEATKLSGMYLQSGKLLSEQQEDMNQDAQEISELTRKFASERLRVRDFEVQVADFEELKQERRTLNREVNACKINARRLRQEVEDAELQHRGLEVSRIEAEARTLNIRPELDEANRNIDQLKESLAVASELTEQAENDLKHANQEMFEADGKLQGVEVEAQRQLKETRDELERTQDSGEKSAKKVTQLESQTKLLREDLGQAQKASLDLQGRFDVLTEDKEDLTKDKAELEEEVNFLKNKRHCIIS